MPRKTQNNQYTVYKHTNTANGKVYIGITSTSIDKRSGHMGSKYAKNPHFSAAIAKYGWDTFDHEIVMNELSLSDAANMERLLIKQYHSDDYRYGYNLSSGGESGNAGCKMSAKERAIRRERMLGKNNPYYGKFGAEHPAYGCKHSDESKEAVRQAMLGRKFSDETIQKMKLARRANAHKSYRKVICLDSGEVFESVKSAASSVNMAPTNITACCMGRQKTVAGLRWAYVSDCEVGDNAS